MNHKIEPHDTHTFPKKYRGELSITTDSLDKTAVSESDLEMLRALSATIDSGGDQEAFEALLDDLSFTLATTLYEDRVDANIKTIRNRRASPEAQQAAKNAQLQLLTDSRSQLLQIAGLDPELGKTDAEKTNDVILRLLADAHEQYGENFSPLAALGILTHNKRGEEVFSYPRGLFPESVDAAWNRYIKAVNSHLKASRDVQVGLADQSDLIEADRARRTAHNSIASSIQKILGLSGAAWDFEESRKLVAKMRENKLPNIKTGEKDRTGHALEKGLSVVKAMRRHLFPGYDSLRYPDEPQ